MSGSRHDDFLDHLLLAMPGLSGKVLVLDAFFDDTRIQPSPETVGVAGLMFDMDGLRRFNEAWAPRVAGLSKPFRTAACRWGHEPFEDWMLDDRLRLLKDLAILIAETRDAGVTATVDEEEYTEFKTKNNGLAEFVGSPFTLTLMTCVDSVCSYMDTAYPNETVNFWFEAGSKNQAEANAFFRRLYDNAYLRERYRVQAWAFVPKRGAVALCAADFLAWEWQYNYKNALKYGDVKWTENFKLLYRDASAKPIFSNALRRNRMGVRAMVSAFHSLHRD
jgi:hypothetical protein